MPIVSYLRDSKFICFMLLLTMIGLNSSPRAAIASSSAAPKANTQVSQAARRESLQVVGDMLTHTENNLIDAGDYYYHHGDYNRDIALNRVVTEIDPSNVEAYSGAGWLLESDGDLKSAEALYAKGVKLNPASSYMGYQLGFFYFNTVHKYASAVKVLKRSVHCPDANDIDYKLLAHSYSRAKDYKAALTTWKIVKARFPNSVAVDHNLQEAQSDFDRFGPGNPVD
jgi:tetratricopeptide (TPR) repeat protein